LDTIKKQARLQGTFTPELEKAFEQVAKGALAASTACISETPNIRFKISTDGVERAGPGNLDRGISGVTA
jgi:hypothetical protein